ncbi:MAG TPA: protein kinase [Terriglobia bacterium]|nr:protein kinase [Terriglobia bacterium]
MIGTTISHYRIDTQLGKGGMGVVYRAHDQRLRRDVALKLLPAGLAGHDDRRARLLAEARAASALNHPGITTIYEVGEDGEHVFIVMELVAGETLRAAVSEGPMETRALARLGAQVAEALAAAHAHGVVHGDVKPENIIVQPDGRVKLLDFGIARQAAHETLAITRQETSPIESNVVGTLAYMAPEQLRGTDADARADLFSLGVVFYELAAGHRPFPGPTATALMTQVLNEAPPPLAKLAPLAPPELARIVHKLLEKQAESRYQSARELQVDLTNLARDLELGAALPAAVAGKRAVAVLPFKLLTPNSEDDYLSMALADAVINQLSASGDLLVRPANTVTRYVKQAVDPLLAARELNVQVIVEGSVQKFGPKLRVHVQAWNAADGETLLSSKHDSEMTDLFGLQDRISEQLAGALGSQPVSKGPTPPPTQNSIAYELYLRAAERLTRLNRWDTRTAIEMLDNATRLDPRFADAWSRLAESCVLMAGTFEPGPLWIKRAEHAVRRALALDPHSAEAQCARGRVMWMPAKNFQERAALRALGKALDINPGCHAARIWRCLILLHVGLHEEAKAGLTEALATNPDDCFTLVFSGQVRAYMGEYAEAEEYYTRGLAIDPSHLWGNLFAAIAPLYWGNFERAEPAIRKARQVLPGEPMLDSCEALLWARRGERRKAEPALRRALKGSKSVLHTHHNWHAAAAAYATIGKPAQAIALIKKAGGFGLPNYPAFRDDPFFQPLHNHPQFLRLMASLKKEWTSYQREFGGV